jgi:peptidoglycan hydrolase-like protein with peptidoglycan-binding domain
VKVEKGKLSAMVSLDGTLPYRARSDGSPYSVINQARGTYTKLPDDGDKVDCGDVFYRVDDNPVLLLCGTVPAYRDLHSGDVGEDVRQLNRNLHTLGYDAGVDIDPDDNDFTWKTEKALEVLQHDKGFDVTGELDIDDAVFLPESMRIAQVTGELGGSAQPGAQVLYATSDTPEVQVDFEASQQGEVKKGAVFVFIKCLKRLAFSMIAGNTRCRRTLPSHTSFAWVLVVGCARPTYYRVLTTTKLQALNRNRYHATIRADLHIARRRRDDWEVATELVLRKGKPPPSVAVRA